MNQLSEKGIYCPYCGEKISVIIDCSLQQQEYIEDCQVCCRPIQLSVSCEENAEPEIQVRHENE